MGSRWDKIARLLHRPVFVLATLAALLATQIRPWWLPVADGCGYLSMARSIAHGGPITNLGSPKLHYPPGYALLISPAFVVDNHPFLLLSVMQWCLAVVFMVGVYCWSRRWFAGAELWITALTMVNASLWMHVRLTISETAFMAAMIWTIVVLDRLATADIGLKTLRWAAAAAVMVLVTSVIRQVGILLVSGYALVVFVAAWRGRASWTRALGTTVVICLPAVLAILALLNYDSRMAETARLAKHTYLDEFRESSTTPTAQVLEGARLRISEAGRLLVPGMYKSFARRGVWLNLNMAVFVLLSIGLGWSWWRIVRGGANVLALTLPFYVGLYVLYPYDQGTRYLLPMLPLLASCLYTLVKRLPAQRVRLLGVLVGAHLAVALGASIRDTRPLAALDAQWPELEAVVAVIGDDPRPVQAWNVAPLVVEMARLAGNRQVREIPAAATPDDAAGWIIAPASQPDVRGFVVHTRTGRFKLLESIQQATRAPLDSSSGSRLR